MEEDDVSDVHVHLQSDLLIVGDSVLTDRHHASSTNYEPDDPGNQIGGILPSFTLSGWLRHGMEAVVQRSGGTVCHPGEPNGNYVREAESGRDLDAGYHEKGACVDDAETDAGCIVFDLFGGFDGVPGKVMRRHAHQTLRRREERIVHGSDQYSLATIDHRQVVAYTGSEPVKTAKNGVTRVGPHTKYGFGELRVIPVDAGKRSENGRIEDKGEANETHE